MPRTKKTCDHNCFRCKYDDCVMAQGDITQKERLSQDRRDMNYTAYGNVPYARRQRKDRGRRT